MKAFRDLPIRRKLLYLTLGPSAVGLMLAGVGFLIWDVAELRREIRQDVQAQARIVSENSAAALEFLDPRIARENLQVLQIRPRIQVACLYDAGGGLFAVYQRDQAAACPSAAPAETRVSWERFEQVEPVMSAGSRVGTLYLTRELTDVADRLRFGTATVLGLLALAIVTASAIARGMQRAIANPLLNLADVARRVSTTRDYSLRAQPAAGDEIGVVVNAFNDMIDRIGGQTTELSKANAELADANRLKDEFLATLSHELRTPLNAMLGWTRLLRSAQLEAATAQRALESIERNARIQTRLIEDLLEVSRIVTGKLRLQVRDVDLAAIVDAAAEIVQPAAAAKRLTLDVDVSVRPAMTSGDPDRLQQVIWNLLSNAVKFTPAGGAVTVRLTRNNGYRVTVRDNGPGIDPRFLPFVFEPFRQADGTASREHGGLGLGLAIAKQLVELHGGTIEARSGGKDTGATFEVFLPSIVSTPARSERIRTGLAPPAQATDGSLLHDVRVLVIDDEEDARLLMQTALAQYGADVTTASSVVEALYAFDRDRPDVVVSDIGMPNEDGYAFIRQLRARPESEGGLVPAVAVTAYASERDRSATDAAGYQAHVAKPFEPAEVARLIARLCASGAAAGKRAR